MPFITLALHLPQLLLRLLRPVLPFQPFAPVPSSRPPLGPPRASRRALSRRNHPPRRPALFGVNACLAPANPLNAIPVPRPAAGQLSPAPDTPKTSAKTHPAVASRVFSKKLLLRARRLAQHPANTPSVPAPSPGPSAGHMPHAQGTCQPIPVAPMGRPALSLAPPSARAFPASEARNLAQKNPPKPSLASPSPLGTAWRETVPPFTPTPTPHGPCTLLPRSSTVTPESRS